MGSSHEVCVLTKSRRLQSRFTVHGVGKTVLLLFYLATVKSIICCGITT